MGVLEGAQRPVGVNRRNLRAFLKFGFPAVLIFVLVAAVAIGAVYYFARPKPVDPQKIRNEALALYRKGDFRAAIPKLRSYLEKEKDDAETRNLLVTSYAQLGQTEAALLETERILRIRPQTELLYRAGQLASELKQYDKAIDYLKRAIKAKPETIQFHFRLAEVHTLTEDYQGALAEWQTVLDLFPVNEPYRAVVYRNIGDTFLFLGETAEARKAFEQGLLLEPGDLELKAGLAKTGP